MIDLRRSPEFLEDGVYVISVVGELDEYTAPLLEHELQTMRECGAEIDIVDLTDCDFIDSTALEILVRAQRRRGDRRSRLSLVTADRNIRKVFQITGLDRILTIHPTRAAAMNGGLRV